tara:strand:+ start:4121 stop:4336 length:216 start_codon:yes stop_codon:yes gene_type:complete
MNEKLAKRKFTLSGVYGWVGIFLSVLYVFTDNVTFIKIACPIFAIAVYQGLIPIYYVSKELVIKYLNNKNN